MEQILRFLLSDYSLWTVVLALVLGVLQTRHQFTISRAAEASLL